MTYCERLQQFLVEEGAASLKDDTEAQQHLVDCTDCFDFLEALQQVDTTLERMPEHDAPDALVQQTLAAITGAAAPAPTPAPAQASPPPPAAKPSRMRRLLAFVHRVLALAWGIASLRWLRRRLAARKSDETPKPEKRRWLRLLTSPKFLIPATALPSLFLLVTVVAVGTVTYNAPESYKSVADSGMVAPAEPSSGEFARDGLADAKQRAERQAEVKQKFSKMFDESGASDDTSVMTGTEIGEAEGMGGLGIRGGGPGGGGVPTVGRLSGSGAMGALAGPQPTTPPADAPDEPQRFANAMVADPSPEPEPMPVATPKAPPPPAKKPQPDFNFVPEKPQEQARDGDYAQPDDPLKNLLPQNGAELDELRERIANNERDLRRNVTKREEKKESKKDKITLESKPRGATLAFEEVTEEDIPEVTRRYKGGGKRDSSRRTGYLSVNAPDGKKTQVIIDGRVAGHAPVTTEVAQGQHRVQLRADGYESEELTVEVTGEHSRHNPAQLLVSARTDEARRFLFERKRTTGLRFKRADGYWANTYVPGDPAMRLLQSRLERADRSAYSHLSLDRAARQYAQPFDPPTTSALDVYLHADAAGVDGESRMLVQVGIQGTPRRSRSRPTMNVGVVLDLSSTPATEQQNAMRALVMALGEARDIGDRFSLVVAGRPGGLLVPSQSFKHGPLTVAMRSLLAGESAGESLSIRQAMERAIGIVVGEDDPTTPLGSSVVLLVTPNTLDHRDLYFLTEMAHESAVNGVPISTVGVGPNIDIEQLDRVTLAGQGNRRLMSAPSEAEALVDRELSSVSRVIARAVRLRIRLAPGVELIDVIGSHRLDEARAEKVRQAEQSIDRRMSKNLGVTSDRGEDEDGIQIVIPSYYAGDTHVILLDVVAPGPGPIADVRVRYKDLVYLKNGVSRANLTAKRGNLRAGPLEHNVLKNFLARRVSAALERAGTLVETGDAHAARRVLNEQATLLASLMQEIPTLGNDRDLLTDITMLSEYTRVLTSVAQHQHGYVADSLKYAAFLKVLPRPAQD